MKLSTQLDCDLIAVESQDEVTLLVEITAPTPPVTAPRATATLQVVLDRSGSMAGDRLEGAKAALVALVDRLDPTDHLGVVAFDDQVQVVVPAGPLSDKQRVKQAIADIHPGGSTDLSAGYLRGLQEAKRVASAAGATLLLISDGHANAGVTDPTTLGKVAKEAASERVTTSVLGFGLGYDEVLLSALAQGGGGNELFAENADTAVALIGGEVEGLLEQVAQAASLRIAVTDPVQTVTVLNDLTCVALPDGLMVELGSFYGGENRRIVVKLGIPQIAALGLAQVATLDLTHVSLPDLIQHTTSVPVHVNVVPGDVAAGRVPDPTVVSEALFQQSQRTKKEAGRMMSRGDAFGAAQALRAGAASLREWSLSAPAGVADDLLLEADLMGGLAEESLVDLSRAAKSSSHDSARKSRTRGRAARGGLLLQLLADPAVSEQLDEFQLTRMARQAPDLAQLPSLVGSVASPDLCALIANGLEPGSALWTLFRRGAEQGGVAVSRT